MVIGLDMSRQDLALADTNLLAEVSDMHTRAGDHHQFVANVIVTAPPVALRVSQKWYVVTQPVYNSLSTKHTHAARRLGGGAQGPAILAAGSPEPQSPTLHQWLEFAVPVSR